MILLILLLVPISNCLTYNGGWICSTVLIIISTWNMFRAILIWPVWFIQCEKDQQLLTLFSVHPAHKSLCVTSGFSKSKNVMEEATVISRIILKNNIVWELLMTLQFYLYVPRIVQQKAHGKRVIQILYTIFHSFFSNDFLYGILPTSFRFELVSRHLRNCTAISAETVSMWPEIH